MHANERREVTTTHFLQLFPCATFRGNLTDYKSVQHREQVPTIYTLREVLAEVFVDEDNDFDPDVGDSLSN